jgi:hypothetical protein
MYEIGLTYYLSCGNCSPYFDSFLHHSLMHESGHQFVFCAKCGDAGLTYSRTAFPGNPAQYRALWALLSE